MTGSVNISAVGSMWLNGSTIRGPLNSTGAERDTCSGATVTGSVSVALKSGPVSMGGASEGGDNITGSMSLTSNFEGVSFDNAHMTGSVPFASNADGVDITGDAIAASATLTRRRYVHE